MAAKNGIPDDWEHLSDDSYSVVSVPTSDDGKDDGEAVDESVRFDADVLAAEAWPRSLHGQPSPAPAPAPASTAGHNAREARGAPAEGGRTSLQQASATAARPAAAPRDDPPADPFNSADYEYESDTVDELLDARTNPDPAFFLRTLHSLADILVETAQSGTDLSASGVRAHRIVAVCNRLTWQVQELAPIIARYARLWSAAARDIPLDPNLHGWMSGVRVKLLGVQAEMQQSARRAGTGSEDAPRLGEYCEALGELQRQMDDFLPIIQIDFNEFQAKHMNFPASKPPAVSPAQQSPPRPTTSAPIPIRNAAPPPPHDDTRPGGGGPRPSSDMWLLRHELYGLKDEVQHTVEQLPRCTPYLPAADVQVAADVAESLRDVLGVLTQALSNHASDWIEHDLRHGTSSSGHETGPGGGGGGLTHAEFARLDPEQVRGIRLGFAAVWGLPNTGPRGRQRAPWEDGEDEEEQAERRVELEDGQLAEIVMLAQVLSSTFMMGYGSVGA